MSYVTYETYLLVICHDKEFIRLKLTPPAFKVVLHFYPDWRSGTVGHYGKNVGKEVETREVQLFRIKDFFLIKVNIVRVI